MEIKIMKELLKYMPIFRVRQEEVKVLKSFDFGDEIYPCIEIIKELDRMQNKKTSKKTKIFEDVYLPLIKNISAKKVFVDLPVHLKRIRKMKQPTLEFLSKVIVNRKTRTEYIKKLIPVANKVIPIISTYSEVTGEMGSITIQENELRPYFKTIAFRTFFKTFSRDISQIEPIIKKEDYIILDWEEIELDLNDGDIEEIIEKLSEIDCNIIVHRNQFPKDFKLSEINHKSIIDTIDNSLLKTYKDYSGIAFSDYVGIKKDDITEGGVVSPGFVYYDATSNNFYGYRYKYGSHKKGERKPSLSEFETTIIPAVITSDATKRMQAHPFDFLGENNKGWMIINNINNGSESGKIAAKFKRISMEHYLHCIKARISNRDI